MNKGIIFDIKRYAIHDGPGIRTTVFLKGCPLRCLWCHNPEGQSSKPELFFRESQCFDGCTECLAACPKNALSLVNKSLTINRKKCDLCGKCVEACVYEALEISGREVTVEEVMKEIEKDRVFFDESGGGVTFSGGEPLYQPGFLNSLLEECKKKDIHTAVDTCGYAPSEVFEKIRDKVDLFLYDVKIIEDKRHQEATGVSNTLILKNLKELSNNGCKISVRIPVIPGINDSGNEISKIAEFLSTLEGIEEISLLPYHKAESKKYESLNILYKMENVPTPANSKIEKMKKMLGKYGFQVKIGG